jgi:hypothetical protein
LQCLGITCDGCSAAPIQGYRYKCKNCKNHDYCEACFASFKGGVLLQDPATMRINPINKRLADHEFNLFVEKGFSSMLAGGAKSAQPKKVGKKMKPNEPCSCASGKKYKKCCMNK